MQVRAIGYLFEYFLGVSLVQGTLLGCGLVVFYSSFGGMRAVVATDALQFGILIIAIPLLAYWGLKVIGGYDSIIASVPSSHLSLFPHGSDAMKHMSTLALYAFPGINIMALQRLLMARNAKQGAIAWQITAGLSIPFYGVIGLIGLIAFVMNSHIEPRFALLYPIQQLTSAGAQGFLVIGLFAVLMSSADSMLHVATVMLTHDLITPLRSKPITPKAELRLAQFVSFLLGSFSMIVALKFYDIITVGMWVHSFWTVMIPIPLIAAVYGFCASGKTLVRATCISVAATACWKIWGTPATGISSFVPGLLFSFFSFFGLRMLDPPHERIPVAERGKSKEVKVEAKEEVTLGSLVYQTQARQRLMFCGYVLAIHLVPCFFPGTWAQSEGTLDVWLRLSASLLCWVLMFADDFPLVTRRYIPKVWRFAVMYCLPFLGALMLLLTQYSALWQLNFVFVMCMLPFLVTRARIVAAMGKGIGFALLVHAAVSMNPLLTLKTVWAIPGYFVLFCVLAAWFVAVHLRLHVLSYAKRLHVLRQTFSSSAHESITRLSSLRQRCSNVQRLFPKLLESHKKAEKAGLQVEEIPSNQLFSLQHQVPRLVKDLRAALAMLKLFLGNLRGAGSSPLQIQRCSIRECVMQAYESFPFEPGEQDKVHLDLQDDFEADVDIDAVIHAVLNPLANSINFMRRLRRGEIFITLRCSGQWGDVELLDTIAGIAAKDMPYVLDEFYSKRPGGSGLGLPFCAKVMRRMGGRLLLFSEEGKYTKVVLRFPIPQQEDAPAQQDNAQQPAREGTNET
ncbi:MAG: ATP-binding protein, partial [Myxococcota bacterium]